MPTRVLFVLLALAAGTAFAQAPAGEPAQKRQVVVAILEQLNLGRMMDQQIDALLATVQRQAPLIVREANVPFTQGEQATQILVAELAGLKGALQAFALDAVTQAYVDAFTLAELQELLAFYQTPLGRKLAGEVPRLQAQGMREGAREGERMAMQAMCRAFAKIRQQGIEANQPPFCR